MGAKERSENLAATCFTTMRRHSHFAGTSTHSHSTAQHSVTCPVGARNLVEGSVSVSAEDSMGHLPYSKDELRRRLSKVSFLRFGRGLPFNILSLRTVHPQQTYLLNEPISYPRRHGNPMLEGQKTFDVEEQVISFPHPHALDPFC